MPFNTSFTYITSYSQLSEVLPELSRSRYLILDCEGQSIGTGRGKLSLLCLGTENAESVYVLDVLTLCNTRTSSMVDLFDLLRNPSIPKVMFDGRNDHLEIKLTYGVSLQGVLDLQVAEVVSRAARGQGERDRLFRLGARGALGIALVNQLGSLLDGIYRLCGVDGVLKDFSLATDMAKDVEVVQMHRNNQSIRWLERPLPSHPNLLQYAANDIYLIGILYKYFCRQDWIHPELSEQSRRYISVMVDRRQRDNTDTVQSGGYLPLDVLTDQSQLGYLYDCRWCGRSLSLSCYQTKKVLTSFGTTVTERREECRLCAACSLRSGKGDASWVNVHA